MGANSSKTDAPDQHGTTYAVTKAVGRLLNARKPGDQIAGHTVGADGLLDIPELPAPPAPEPEKPVAAEAAPEETYKKSVMEDRPKNVFGPGHSFSPDAYANAHNEAVPINNWLLEFNNLERDEKYSCFSTFGFFQGKMGLLLRQCDLFSQQTNIYQLFRKCAELTEHILGLSHARLWQIDHKAKAAICLYNNDDVSFQNGRKLPSLGSFVGEIARGKKVVVINGAGNDSRFKSWQYIEMQQGMEEPLGVIIGVALTGPPDVNGKREAKYIFEAYDADVTKVMDGSDAFLVQTLADFAGPAAVAIRTRWEQDITASLPRGILTSATIDEYLEYASKLLCNAMGCEEAEIYMVEEGRTLWVVAERLLGEADRRRAKREAAKGKQSLVSKKKRFDISSTKSIIAEVARRALKGNFTSYVSEQPTKDPYYSKEMDSMRHEGREDPTLSLVTAPMLDSNENLVAVVQLRNRRWNTLPLTARDLRSSSGFADFDVLWLESLGKDLGMALLAANRKEANRKQAIEAMMADRRAKSIMNMTQLAATARADDMERIFRVVVEEIMSLLNCDRATMWLISQDKDGRSCLYSMVQSFPIVEGTPLLRIQADLNPDKKSIVSTCALDPHPIINIPDAYDSPLFDRQFDKRTGYRTRSMLTLPIVNLKTDNVKGCIQCLNKMDAEGETQNMYFTGEDEEFAKAFASILAVALDLQSERALVEGKFPNFGLS